jgi:RNA recognition motif-containing protein
MAHKLFVGGLNFATSNERLRELFAECGQVDSATVVTDRDTGRSRGFGFVEMDDAGATQAISALNGASFQDRNLKVNESQPRESRPRY